MKKILFPLLFLAAATTVQAQNFAKRMGFDHDLFNHLDLSVTAGTTGVGFDLAMPVGKYLQVRTGAAFMPKIHYDMLFDVMVGDQTLHSLKKESGFQQMINKLESLTGIVVKDKVTMVGEPSFNNFKFLIDVFPFRNKHWHITAGFYIGNGMLGYAYNKTDDMASLLGVMLFNNLYDRINNAKEANTDIEGLNFSLPKEYTDKILSYGRMSLPEGCYSHDIYASEDVYWDHDVKEVYIDKDVESDTYNEVVEKYIHHKGDLKVAKGDVIHKKGDPYLIEPNEEGMVKVQAKIKRFKPYLGFGYGGPISKDHKTSISFDAGLMFWGGTPNVIVHDGIDLINDVEGTQYQVADYVKFIKKFKCFPVISLRITQRLF